MNVNLSLEELGLLVDALDINISDSEANFEKHKRFYTAEYKADVEAEIRALYKLQDKLIDAITKV